MAVVESVEKIVKVDITSEDYTNPEAEDRVKCLIFCTTAGDVNITMLNGVTTSKTMFVGEYWRITPHQILSTSSAVVEIHT